MNWRRFFRGSRRGVARVARGGPIESETEPARSSFYPLTPRQAQVSALVAAGLSDNEIANAIVINKTTIAYQVYCVLTKLGFDRRSEITDWVAHHFAAPDPLSTQEFQLAALIAAGLTNGEMARRLGVSERTMEVHVAMICRKLDFQRREQIVPWVTRFHLRSHRPAV